ncbi:hypothetical protein FQA39_LY15873 [Lamprigera yunnana]|nr:hypothetical protein FQA39_LY15873 [Lamprigera yunnana]
MFIHAIMECAVLWNMSMSLCSDHTLKTKARDEVCDKFIRDYSIKTSKQNGEKKTQPPSLPTIEQSSQRNSFSVQNERKGTTEDTNKRDEALHENLAEKMAKKEEDNQEEIGGISPDCKIDARMEILNTMNKYKQLQRCSVQNYNFSGYFTGTVSQFSSPSTHTQTSSGDYMPSNSLNFHVLQPSQNVTIPPQSSPSK